MSVFVCILGELEASIELHGTGGNPPSNGKYLKIVRGQPLPLLKLSVLTKKFENFNSKCL